MLINLADATKADYDFSYDAINFFKGLMPRITSNVKVKGDYNKTSDGEVEVIGSIEYDLEYPCARCLKPISKHYHIEFDELYSEDDEDFTIVDDIIDLTDMVNDNIILNISSRLLCDDDCKGLCPNCGTNLNINKCECDISIDDLADNSPFSMLKDITTGGAEDGSTKKKNI